MGVVSIKKIWKKVSSIKNKSIETKELQKCSEVIRDFWKKDEQIENVVEIWDYKFKKKTEENKKLIILRKW